MKILSTKGWDDYELLDSGSEKRFERFGKYTIVRPDPQVIWKPNNPAGTWKANSTFIEGKGWSNNLDKWELKYKDIKFYAKLTPFKHTGVFPEQILNWEFIENSIILRQAQDKKELNILNLFGYTGIASLVCAVNGCTVTHVDGSKPSISWARENQELSGLTHKPIRWILDDVLAFTEREVRRGNKYDGVIMDPPVYGHGPSKEIWDFNKSFPQLLENCRKILVPNPSFVIINAYAISSSSLMLANMIVDYLNIDFDKIEYGELALREKSRNRLLSTGIFARFG